MILKKRFLKDNLKNYRRCQIKWINVLKRLKKVDQDIKKNYQSIQIHIRNSNKNIKNWMKMQNQKDKQNHYNNNYKRLKENKLRRKYL